METNNDRSNQQGQNFGDIENTPNDMITPNAENKETLDIDKINEELLADDENATGDETETDAKQDDDNDYSANDRSRNDNSENLGSETIGIP